MATSRRESQPNARLNRTARNTSPALKPIESEQVLRRARSVPSSPDRKTSASTAAANPANRPSSSFNPRTASSRSTSGSASSSSSAHGKSTLLHSVSAMVGAKQAAGTMRRRAADKSGGATSVWPHALTTPSTTSPNKDPASKAVKSSSSNAQKSKLSTRPGAEKTAAVASSPKPRTQKATTTPGPGKTLTTSSSARNPGATAKRRTGLEISVLSIQRTTSVPVAPKAEEQDVDLLMEGFDEMESISTPSIEEHLQQRLPDPVDVTAYATSEHAPSEPSPNREEHKDGQEVATEHMFAEGKHEDVAVVKEALGETHKEAANETGLKESADENELNETVGEIELKGDVDEPKLHEADSETELKEAGSETEIEDPELAVKKDEAKANEDRMILPATKTPETVQRWRKDDGRSNEVTEEGRSKTAMQERRNKVMALVGRFETAMSGRD
ncbi:hypothetical protein PR202_ga00680 [Eleusine coracana subsp. coracana]|uniref:Calmodulin-binding domain-containing protein n=1 Tax=Eleusine coracana subsp. coracana TaxID=191504 RepID=A0AAV5BGA7_ELECO|nr:hypothetical protein QOZ80_2AG0130200 [Eleusine coracana subsp. coracana]GJM84962.1 hypothetical protein PR202_ga00680 [Eleusine coracana subsp. coracana]